VKQKLADQKAALANTLAVYGPNHPASKRAQQGVADLQKSLEEETRRIVQTLRTNYTATHTRERMLAGEMKSLTDEAKQMAQYSELKKGAQTNTDLYNALFQRIKETGISAASKSSNIQVVDRAHVLDLSTSPHIVLNLAVAMFLGLFGGIAMAFVKENFDDTVATPEQVKHWTGLPAIALVPQFESSGRRSRMLSGGARGLLGSSPVQHDLFVKDRPRSLEAEAIRGLRTSILLSGRGTNKTILVVSPFADEGKTTIAANLAIALADIGKTCVVDADVRKSDLTRAFGLESHPGVAEVAAGMMDLPSVVSTVNDVKGLTVLSSGIQIGNPCELAFSDGMRQVIEALRGEHQYIVIDTAPLFPYADARALSALVDGLVLVSRSGVTTRQALTRSRELLAGVKAPLIGVVLNGVSTNSSEYRYYAKQAA
jgi:capsular exopolysaccharide synthesis family protein